MIIEIRKVGFVNKGAELMLRAILERLREAYPNATFTMTPTHSGASRPFRKLVRAGLYPKASLYRYGVQWGHLAGWAPRKLREMYGLVLDRDVDVVIDAAGFSYSDQWGVRGTRELAHSARRWRRQGTKVILMPQAFGPFKTPRIRSTIQRVTENVDLMMPREPTSHKHLTEVVGEQPHIREYPDFTNLINGVVPKQFDSSQHRVCIVPNYRMVDKTDGAESTAYLPFMTRCAQYLAGADAKPFVLVHGGEGDMWLAERISEASGGIPILTEEDPLKIKGVLGASHATIGSRFHGLVSALSQGVPSLATGWSHKYVELFRDYGVPDSVLSVHDPEREVTRKIERIVETGSNLQLSKVLCDESARLKRLSTQMWKEVFGVIHESRRLGRHPEAEGYLSGPMATSSTGS